MFQLLNSPQFAFCYIAPQKLGPSTPLLTLILPLAKQHVCLTIIVQKAYIYDCEIKETAHKALELCEYKPPIILAVDYRGERPALPEGHIFFDDYIKDSSTADPVMKEEPNLYDEVTRLYTSGTTGLPKSVPLNNVNEVLSAHDVIMHFPLCPLDITMNMSPWFHRGGLHSGGLTPTFYVGGTCVVLRVFSTKLCMEYTEKYGVTFLIGSPSALNSLVTRQGKNILRICLI